MIQTILSDDRYISQCIVYFVMSFRQKYELLLCAIWVKYDIMTCLISDPVWRMYRAFKCGAASEPLARHLQALPWPCEIVAR